MQNDLNSQALALQANCELLQKFAKRLRTNPPATPEQIEHWRERTENLNQHIDGFMDDET